MDHLFQGLFVAGNRANGGYNFGVRSFVSHFRLIWDDKVILIGLNQKIYGNKKEPGSDAPALFLTNYNFQTKQLSTSLCFPALVV